MTSTDRRNNILEAAHRVIAWSGAHDLRIEDVAREAGISPSLVYYYFDTRAELLEGAFSQADADSTSFTLARIDEHASPRERIESIMMLELDDAPEVAQNWVVWSELEASAMFDEELLASLRRSTDRWVRIVSDLIEAGRKDGSLRRNADPRRTAILLTNLVDGIGTHWVLGAIGRERARSLVREAVARELGHATG